MEKSGLKELKKYNFYRHGNYRNSFLFCCVIFKSLTKTNFSKSGNQYTLNPLVAINLDHYVDEKNAKQLTESYYKKIKNNIKFLDEYYKGHFNDYEKILKYAKKIYGMDLKKIDDRKLLILLQKWFEINIKNIHWLWSMEFLNSAIDKYVKEILNENIESIDERNDILFFLGEPSEDIEAIKARIEYLKIAIKIKNRKERLQIAAKKLEKKFGWLGLNTWNGTPYKAAYFEKKLNHLINRNPQEELLKILRGKKTNKQNYKKAMNLLPLSYRRILRQVPKLVYLKSSRIEILSKSFWYVSNLFKLTSEKLGVSLNDFMMLTTEEIIVAVSKGKINLRLIRERKKDYGICWMNNKLFIVYGKQIKNLQRIVSSKIGKKKYLMGSVAYPGKVIGRVRIVDNETEIKKIQKNDILVAPMTNPNYDPVLHKIKAMIADEGGILTHTSIVAREFKIPTIIGTKIATQILKDGDLVEVDANKGIVKILK